MKTSTILALAMCILAAFSVSAQPQKGQVVIGAFSQITPGIFPVPGLEIQPNRLGFGIYNQKSTHRSSFGTYETEYAIRGFNLSPDIGFMLADQFMLGLHGSLLYTRIEDKEDDYKNHITIMQVGPMVRYFLPIAGPFQMSIGGSYGIGNLKTKYEDDGGTDEETSKLSGFNLGLGGDYFITPDVSLGLRLEYQRNQLTDEDGDFESEDVTSGVGFRLGFQCFLGRKSES